VHDIGIAGKIPQSLQLQSRLSYQALADVTCRESARSITRVHQRVSVIKAVAVPVFVYLHSNRKHVTMVRGS